MSGSNEPQGFFFLEPGAEADVRTMAAGMVALAQKHRVPLATALRSYLRAVALAGNMATVSDFQPRHRWFCDRHATRGDCGIEDADDNYEPIDNKGIGGDE